MVASHKPFVSVSHFVTATQEALTQVACFLEAQASRHRGCGQAFSVSVTDIIVSVIFTVVGLSQSPGLPESIATSSRRL